MLMTWLDLIQDLPDAWLGAGAIIQNVWNVLHDLPLNTHLKDIDVLYYENDLTWEREDDWIQRVQREARQRGLTLPVDVKNVARIHLWYSEKFGDPQDYPPFEHVGESVYTWPFTAAAVAVQQAPEGHLSFVAPFGFQDLFSMRLRPNLGRVSLEVCQEKARRWQAQWPQLTTVGLRYT